MTGKASRSIALPLLASIALGGRASQGETIQHGVPPDPGDSIPSGSSAICPGVPAGTPLIPDLRTGRAMVEPSTASLRLLFSDHALACQEQGAQTIATLAQSRCESAWAFSMLLLPEMQKPGVYALADYAVELQDSIATMIPERGCGGACGGGGGGSSFGGVGGAISNTPGVIEIYSVTDQCITGRFQGLMTGQVQPPPPDLDGAFHAVRCTPVPSTMTPR